MANKKTHGKTASGKPITDELVEKLAKKAEAGYNVEETLRRRPGRPSLGSAPAAVESVRLEPELQEALTQRAKRDRETTSSVIRRALRKYLEVR
ncbi:MAG: hypothetical protein QOD60_1911 [Solirubrobacterales bacterium]|jgi:CRISPR-associated endonuclease/helicase Cas3|nr:hypothetical protein [Solirubrobacterales bacterium]